MKMTFTILFYVIILTGKGLIIYGQKDIATCGIRPIRRHPRNITVKERNPKIIDGSLTVENQYPWQVSLEVLHPSMGFLGHWCGAVLIDRFWVLSAAHCIHNDLFNLPLPPLWTVVLGEHNRYVETGFEQRIPVEKIVMHNRYANFQHDLVLLKLSTPANIEKYTNVRKICLPFIVNNYPQSMDNLHEEPLNTDYIDVPDRDNNYLRHLNASGISNKTSILGRRRNDKFLHSERYVYQQSGTKGNSDNGNIEEDLPYMDCIATGWGKSTTNGDLTDILLQTNVPLHSNEKCADAYGENVKIHQGHLCGGKLNGKGGTCVGDSGGPLQCRLTINGPWILAGLTSFGSGCAEQGYPDVYTRITYYLKWIYHTIKFN